MAEPQFPAKTVTGGRLGIDPTGIVRLACDPAGSTAPPGRE